jgi:hypothetical protein
MSVTAIKNGKRNGRVGVMNFDGRRKYNTTAIVPKIRVKIISLFNRER